MSQQDGNMYLKLLVIFVTLVVCESSNCLSECYMGTCVHGMCQCKEGWSGVFCDQCSGRILLDEKQGILSLLK